MHVTPTTEETIAAQRPFWHSYTYISKRSPTLIPSTISSPILVLRDGETAAASDTAAAVAVASADGAAEGAATAAAGAATGDNGDATADTDAATTNSADADNAIYIYIYGIHRSNAWVSCIHG